MDIPTILAGPILRRVDTKQINIWIATSERLTIGAELFEVNINHKEDCDYKLISQMTETQTMRIGQKLFIYLIKILPEKESTFPEQTLLGYNLHFKSGPNQFDLSSFDLLTPHHPQSIVYGNLAYPSFYINNGKEPRFLYGSCRKPHGKGRDSLSGADMQLEQTHVHLPERPHALFLTGDQIYADDVADPLFSSITRIGEMLIGKEKTEDLNLLDPRLREQPFKQSINQINGRSFIMEHFCKFTSRNASNHLMKFAEYAAMYLMSWSPALWQTLQTTQQVTSFEEEMENQNIYFIFPDEPRFNKERMKEFEQQQTRYIEQSEQLFHFQHSLPKVRRLLANIPTYMIFDDHDITDDWNLTVDWKKDVWHSPLGRHVITNGLAAYWVFQGWGNDPDTFDNEFIKTMRRYLYSFKVGSAKYEKWVEQLWQFNSWHFVTPTHPEAIFLDTRTQRSSDTFPQPIKVGNIMEETKRIPKLISQDAWKRINTSLEESNWQKGEPLIIISPPPVYGLGLIESFLHRYVYPLRGMGIPVHTLFDFEAWKYNGEGFSDFLNQVAEWEPEHCMIISGDVHYASSVKSVIEFQNEQHLELLQFTSSPILNMSFKGIWGVLAKLAIGLNVEKREKQDIRRFCNQSNKVHYENDECPCPVDYKWKEIINYLDLGNESIIETDNNIGLLSITKDHIQNSLLQVKNYQLKESRCEPIVKKRM